MRDHDDRRAGVVQRVENIHDLVARSRVQRAGRLVRQQQLWAAHDGTRNGDALALTAGELVRAEIQPLTEAHHLQRLNGALAALLLVHTGVQQRQGDIIHSRELRQQIEALEHKAEQAVADLRQLVFVGLGDILARQQVFAARRYVKAADEIHERRLAGAGRAHDGEIVALLDLQVDVFQNADGLLALRIILADILHFNEHR